MSMNLGAEKLAKWLNDNSKSLGQAQFDLRVTKQLLSLYVNGDGKPGRKNAAQLRDAVGIAIGDWDAPPQNSAPGAAQSQDKGVA